MKLLFLLLLFSIYSSEICEIKINLSRFHILNLGDEVQEYSIDINTTGKINGYYRVYHLFGECYVSGNEMCDNSELNTNSDAFMIHNDFLEIKNGTIIFESLCNLEFPNLACDTRKVGDYDLYTNRILILENDSGLENVQIILSIKKTEYDIKVPSCKDYKSKTDTNSDNPFSWLTNSTFMLVGFCLAIICYVVCCLFKLCVRVSKCIIKKC